MLQWRASMESFDGELQWRLLQLIENKKEIIMMIFCSNKEIYNNHAKEFF